MSRTRWKYVLIGLPLLGLVTVALLLVALAPLFANWPSGYPLIDLETQRLDTLRNLMRSQEDFHADNGRYATSEELIGISGMLRDGSYVYVVVTPDGWIGAAEPPNPFCGRAFYCTHDGEVFRSPRPLRGPHVESVAGLAAASRTGTTLELAPAPE